MQEGKRGDRKEQRSGPSPTLHPLFSANCMAQRLTGAYGPPEP